MEYSPKQMEYIDSVDGEAHQSAVRIIAELEKVLEDLLDVQNGPPLIKYEDQWNEITARAYKILKGGN